MSEPTYTPLLNKIEFPQSKETKDYELQDLNVFEDNEAFKRIRNLTQKLSPHLVGDLHHYLSLLEIAFENSLTEMSADEQKETLKILRDYNPIIFDILCDLIEVDPYENYQTSLKKMILTLEGRKTEVNFRYSKVMGLFSLTGRVPSESAQYSDFIQANHFKVQRNIIIAVLIMFAPAFIVICLALTYD